LKYVSPTTRRVPMDKIRVLIVEDDPMVAYVNKKYTEMVEEFVVIGVVQTGKGALEFLKLNAVELIILDLYLPQMGGVEALETLRREGHDVDVIVITAADDSKTVSKVLRHGVIAYIEKPFQIERYQLVLEAYSKFFHKTHNQQYLNQEEIDCLLVTHKQVAPEQIPKNFSSQTLESLVDYLASQNQFLSAQEVAFAVGLSRGTVRRYLEYAVEQGLISKVMDYKSIGRPVNLFKIIVPNFEKNS